MKTNVTFLSKIVVLFLMLTSVSNSQIVNIPTGGTFIVRHALTPNPNYLTVTQSTGMVDILNSLRLDNTTSNNIGVIYKGADRFLHNFGISNTFLGVKSGNINITNTGLNNTGMGTNSLQQNTTGSFNTAIGVNSLFSNTTGYYNTAIGDSSMFTNIDGYFNTSVGSLSMARNTSGTYNTAFGENSLHRNTTGEQNTAIGGHALYFNTTGSGNIALGLSSLQKNTTGEYNIGIGGLTYNTTGNYNVTVGGMYLNTFGGTPVTGNENTTIGILSGYNITTGSNNIAIGYQAAVPDGSASNQVRIGDTLITYAGIQVDWHITSDKRWKSNILNSNLGLNFISKLNPVSYTRNNDKSQKIEYGFIAQEVEEVLKESNIENSGMINIDKNGKYEMRYNDLLSPMVKAIQELKSENEELKQNNEKLASQLESLKTMNEKIVKLEKAVNEMTSTKHTSLDLKEVNLENSK